MTCDARCRHGNPKHRCRCVCGGVNHGVDYQGEDAESRRLAKKKASGRALAVGDVVEIVKGSRAGKDAFVEDILQEGPNAMRPGEQKVSLYHLDGDYAGDYWTFELTASFRRVSKDELHGLIQRYGATSGPGKDFTRVLEVVA